MTTPAPSYRLAVEQRREDTCKRTGHMPDRDDPSTRIYCGGTS